MLAMYHVFCRLSEQAICQIQTAWMDILHCVLRPSLQLFARPT
jgi:hypothetical protein